MRSWYTLYLMENQNFSSATQSSTFQAKSSASLSVCLSALTAARAESECVSERVHILYTHPLSSGARVMMKAARRTLCRDAV